MASVTRLNINSAGEQDPATENEQSAVAECSPSACGESQGPVQAAIPTGSPLRQQNHCPRPSLGPQCAAAVDNRRSGRRGNGGGDRRAKTSDAESTPDDGGGGAAKVNDGQASAKEAAASTNAQKPVYDDSIRQFLR